MSVPSVKQGENVFREMCDKNGNNDSFTGALVRNFHFYTYRNFTNSKSVSMPFIVSQHYVCLFTHELFFIAVITCHYFLKTYVDVWGKFCKFDLSVNQIGVLI